MHEVVTKCATRRATALAVADSVLTFPAASGKWDGDGAVVGGVSACLALMGTRLANDLYATSYQLNLLLQAWFYAPTGRVEN